MTSPTSVNYSPPSDWQQFERLSRSLLSEIYKSQFQRWGRGGQRQNGVDAFLIQKDKTAIAIQCKGRNSSLGIKLQPSDIDKAVERIESFPHKIDEFIILTTSQDDIELHNRAAELTKKRQAEGKSRVSVWGWNHINDLIGDHPKIQKNYYGQFFQRISVWKWICLSLVTVLFVFLSVILFKIYESKSQKYELNKTTSINDIKQIESLTENLKNAYVSCEKSLSSNLFTFSYEIEESCTNPIRIHLGAIKSKLDGATIDLDSSAWSDISNLTKIMDSDYRQSLMALDMTHGFEGEVIRSLKDMCNHRTPSHNLAKLRQNNIERFGRDAIISQLNYYFVVRDFIIPGIESMKSRELIFARELNNQPIPDELLEKSDSLQKIISSRQSFVFDAPSQPFTLSAIKTKASRDIKMPSSTPKELNFVEQARWQDVFNKSLMKSFHGKHDDIEELISCGVFKPEARKLETMEIN